MDEFDVSRFLTYLAAQRKVAASTQNQALGTILFLYRDVFKKDLDWAGDVERAKKAFRLPVVFSKREVRGILASLAGVKWFVANLPSRIFHRKMPNDFYKRSSPKVMGKAVAPCFGSSHPMP